MAMSGEYRLSDEEPPKRRHVPLPPQFDDEDAEPEPESLLARIMARDPFPWMLGASVLIWVGLGLASRKWPPLAFVLIAAGTVVFTLGQVYLYVLIYLESPQDALLSFLSGWYRQFYLWQNPELALKPVLLSGVGILMIVTGSFAPHYRKQQHVAFEPRQTISVGSMPS